jgi:hypothetical protein
MNGKEIGNIGEAMTLAKFVEYGIPVYVPFGENQKADFIVDLNGKLKKIQVKTAEGTTDGCIRFYTTVKNRNAHGIKKHKYTPDEVDYFACYSIERNKLFLIDINDNVSSEIRIRFEEGKVNNSRYRWEDDYVFENVIHKLLV